MWTRATEVPFSWLPPRPAAACRDQTRVATRLRHLLGVLFGQGAWKLWQGTSTIAVLVVGQVMFGVGHKCLILVELALATDAPLRIIAEQAHPARSSSAPLWCCKIKRLHRASNCL